MVCRMCKSDGLTPFLDLGFTPPADRFLRKEQLREPEVHYPLVVMLCASCGQVQLGHVVSPEVLYRQDYPYEASLTKTGQRHWAEFARTVSERMRLGAADLVVDIGSNVGVLLAAFRDHGARILGVDPASNIVRIAERGGIETVNEFFGLEVARGIRETRGPATVITGTNVFAHIDDLDDVLRGVDVLLGERGILVIEAPYLVHLIKNLEYDTIYHEHLSYLSIRPLTALFSRFGFEIFDVERRDIHGGSIRIYIGRAGRLPIGAAVDACLREEAEAGVHTLPVLQEFAQAVRCNRQDLQWLVRSLKQQGRRLVGVSAPAKGMTLLNYCHLGPETLDFVTEKSTLKIGRYTPGLHVPVVPDEALLSERPDYALLLAWNFADEIMANLHAYRQAGGKFIIPIPVPRVVDA
ncbi:MAG: class I SAM-dependent methyltransferase [Deltaproteobacteria bacterium]|nr:class I SAM-dependent methyltransferase [Deltaproteobacteria bacterium]